MKAEAVVIENDLFGIAARLKSIDDGYFVVYDKRRHAFEVHNSRQRGNTFSLSVPYPSLDVRTVDLVLKTRVENSEKLFREMEEENRRLIKRADCVIIERAAEKAADVTERMK